MKTKIKKIVDFLGYTIHKKNKVLLLDDNPLKAIKNKLLDTNIVLFDVGANLGQTIIRMNEEYRQAKIFAFEPSKNCFNYLKENFEKNSNISLHNNAIGATSGNLEFNEYSWSALNSLLKRAYGNAKINETYLVEVVTIDSFCISKKISHINLLKTDTEGYELNVLKGASKMMEQNKIQFVFVEIFFNENYIGQSSFGDIYNFLLANRFELVRFYDVNYTGDGLASKTDALFVNRSFKN
jgi:FkbM family methyltransferase